MKTDKRNDLKEIHNLIKLSKQIYNINKILGNCSIHIVMGKNGVSIHSIETFKGRKLNEKYDGSYDYDDGEAKLNPKEWGIL